MRIGQRRNGGDQRCLRRDRIVADHPANFFKQVVLHRDVFGSAPTWHCDRQNAWIDDGYAELQRFEYRADLIERRMVAELAVHPIDRDLYWRWSRQRIAAVSQPTGEPNARRDFPQQGNCASKPAYCIGRVLRFLKTHGRVSAQLELDGRLADAGRREVRALQNYAPGALVNRAFLAADHAGNGNRAVLVRDDEVGRCKLVSLIVQSDDLFAGLSGTDKDSRAAEAIRVEGVHGLSQLGHDVVGDVDDVVN